VSTGKLFQMLTTRSTNKVKQTKTGHQRLHEDWKRCVCRCLLNVFREVAEQTASGRLFQQPRINLK